MLKYIPTPWTSGFFSQGTSKDKKRITFLIPLPTFAVTAPFFSLLHHFLNCSFSGSQCIAQSQIAGLHHGFAPQLIPLFLWFLHTCKSLPAFLTVHQSLLRAPLHSSQHFFLFPFRQMPVTCGCSTEVWSHTCAR